MMSYLTDRLGTLMREAWSRESGDAARAYGPHADGALQVLIDAMVAAIQNRVDDESYCIRVPTVGVADDIVVGIGLRTAPVVRFLAGALGRRHAVYADFAACLAWCREAAPDSILFLGNAALPAGLGDAGLSIPHGFIVANGGRDLVLAAVKAAVFHHLVPRSDVDVIYAPVTEANSARVEDGVLWLVGKQLDLDLPSMISVPKRLFGLLSHSDGISTFLGPANFCMSADGVRGPIRYRPYPTCLVDGFCYRFLQDRESANAQGKLIRPEALAADVFLNMTCWGTQLGSVIHPAISLGHRFNHSPGIRAQITTGSVLSIDDISMRIAVQALRRGENLGACTLRLNRAAKVGDDQPDPYILYGDPAYRPCPSGSALAQADQHVPAALSRPAVPCDEGMTSRLRFLRVYFSRVASRTGRHQIPGARALVDSLAIETETGLDDRLTRSCLELLSAQAARVGSIIGHDWRPLFFSERATRLPEPCRICGHSIVRHVFCEDHVAPVRRRIDICRSCGVIGDGPVGEQTALTVTKRHVVRGGMLAATLNSPAGPIWTVFTVECTRREHSVTHPVRAAAPSHRLKWKVPESFPAGAAILSAFVMRSANLSVLRVPIHIDPGDSAHPFNETD